MLDLADTGVPTDGRLTEKQVVGIWQYQMLDRAGLATEDGRPLDVLYPGRPNDDRGADFRDAVISSNHGLLKGDVELHVRSSDWHSHGHDRDAAYNRVILHVVMRHDRRGNTVLENGLEVPVLALEKYLHAASPGPPCEEADPNLVTLFLNKAGDLRFRAKAAEIYSRLLETNAAQVLYEGVMEALGYTKNKAPFLELARRVPLEVLESITQSNCPDEACIMRLQKMLLGNAERISGWNTFKVRPCNSPAHRIMAMSRLLVKYRKGGILEALTGKVRLLQDDTCSKSDTLEKALTVTAGHRNGSTFTLLGPGRAADIIINVLLPFSFALGKMANRPELKRKARELYRHYPGQTPNSIVSHMTRQFGLGRKDVNTARRQQGLLHIYKEMCVQGRCSECPLGQFKAGIGIQV